VVEHEIGDSAGAALYADGYTGHAQMVMKEDRRVIVGVTMGGLGAGEMIDAATIAVAGEVPLSRLWHAVPSYPRSAKSGCASLRPTALYPGG
jgi:pyruvate/2-oxoglutarate dehydrogenase complex dihydrolipoamide dehydrogenase (E3) component